MTQTHSCTIQDVMRTARSIRVTDVCREFGYPITENGMDYTLDSDPNITIRRGGGGWTDRSLRAQGKTGPETGGGSVEFLMRFAGLSSDAAMMTLLQRFAPDKALWVDQTREQQLQQKRHGLPEKERRPFSVKIKEIRAETQAARESRSIEDYEK